MGGWIKLHRKLKNKAFYSKDSEKVHLWLHLLFCANHKGKEEFLGGKLIICNPGQFTCGRKQLANSTGINESKIERILTYFQKTEQQIEQQKTSCNRLITILNWQDYQESEQQSEQRVNNERTTSEQRVNTLKECKEDKELKNEKNNIVKFNFKNSLLDLGIEKNIVEDWLLVRKNKKATNTETSFKTIKSEIEKTGVSATECIKLAIDFDWKGFRAEWYNNKTQSEVDKFKNTPTTSQEILKLYNK